jgi:hypothetical protein
MTAYDLNIYTLSASTSYTTNPNVAVLNLNKTTTVLSCKQGKPFHYAVDDLYDAEIGWAIQHYIRSVIPDSCTTCILVCACKPGSTCLRYEIANRIVKLNPRAKYAGELLLHDLPNNLRKELF